MAKPPKRSTFYVVGNGQTPPSLEDIFKMFTAITGREPTPEEKASATTKHEAFLANLKPAK